ncbi:MAG TPA: 4-hydroxythreonine-4-phosphate dehydrogenase PdxA [Alphaproteobacteria bacterium]|nr:4-hydroxythreonine-4-phosphate dehydrogenase PdxA [Alphaproteobacteria bacterium]
MPHLALTIGDPTGIGPEITAKALQRLSEFEDLELTVIGDIKSLEKTAEDLKLRLPQSDDIHYHNIEATLPGSTAYKAIEAAVKMIAAKEADILVTGPISKRNLHAADYSYNGHTEILEALASEYFETKDAHAEMLFVYKKFRMLLLTRHVPLKEVPELLAKPGAVARPLKALIRFLRDHVKIEEPNIAILGVNPHVGEVGGDEEMKFIKPVIHAVNAIGATNLAGPFPADGFFRGFNAATTEYDAIVAAYHDQGLIPFKLLAGYEAVNVTIGLPFIRTSVSHGTAEDIVGKGVADEASLMAALHEALHLM